VLPAVESHTLAARRVRRTRHGVAAGA